MSICKLCRGEKTLLKSHIIPEFMYKSMYDEKHRFHCITLGREASDTQKQKGEWDRLLCGDCEQRFSRLERYASAILTGKTPIEIERRDPWMIECGGIDYKLFKLFQLSILWRAGVSDRPIFKEVALGRHQEVLRRMLLDDDPGESYKYGCIMLAAMHKGKPVDSLILHPELARVDGQIVWRFVFAGFWWLYFCSGHKPNMQISSRFLQDSGVGYIFLKELASAEHVVRFAVSSQLKSRSERGLDRSR
jgi:hypothetical protein